MKDMISINDDMTADERKFISDIRAIVYTAKEKAYQAADTYQVVSNWLVGRRIVEQEQHGKARAEYGKHIIEIASKALTEEFGKGYSETQLRGFRKFYLKFKYLQIQQTLSAELPDISQYQSDQSLIQIQQTVSAEFELTKYLPSNLSWSHYERLMRVEDDEERDWYMKEAAGENWSVRTLHRNIVSQYYRRLLQTPESKQGEVMDEMKRLTVDYQKDRHKFLRNPVVAEFLGFPQDSPDV